MGLPPEENPLWAQMEDDIAAERWPMPSPFGWVAFWYRGPRNEANRRSAFKQMVEGRQAFWVLPLVVLLWAVLSMRLGFQNYRRDGLPLYLTLWVAGPILAVVVSFGRGWMFLRSVRRYTREHPVRRPEAAVRSALTTGSTGAPKWLIGAMLVSACLLVLSTRFHGSKVSYFQFALSVALVLSLAWLQRLEWRKRPLSGLARYITGVVHAILGISLIAFLAFVLLGTRHP
jgi:hypothetical protein